MILTVDMLKNAERTELNIFRKLYPDGRVEITKESCLRLLQEGFILIDYYLKPYVKQEAIETFNETFDGLSTQIDRDLYHAMKTFNPDFGEPKRVHDEAWANAIYK